MNEFLKQYIETALWSSHDIDSGENMEELDLAPETFASFKEDCEAFMEEHAADIEGKEGQAGHDFWLTRNRHGAGFWDGDWEAGAAKRLTESSHIYGSVDLYIGDDGLVYSN